MTMIFAINDTFRKVLGSMLYEIDRISQLFRSLLQEFVFYNLSDYGYSVSRPLRTHSFKPPFALRTFR